MQNSLRKIHLSILFALLMIFIFAGCNKEDVTISEECLEEAAFAANVFAQLSMDIDVAVPLEGISSGRHGFSGLVSDLGIE